MSKTWCLKHSCFSRTLQVLSYIHHSAAYLHKLSKNVLYYSKSLPLSCWCYTLLVGNGHISESPNNIICMDCNFKWKKKLCELKDKSRWETETQRSGSLSPPMPDEADGLPEVNTHHAVNSEDVAILSGDRWDRRSVVRVREGVVVYHRVET